VLTGASANGQHRQQQQQRRGHQQHCQLNNSSSKLCHKPETLSSLTSVRFLLASS
jgi:hypothetical protein